MRIVSPHRVRPQVRIVNFNRAATVDSWGPRVIDSPELILITAGSFEYQTPGGTVGIEPGQLLFIPAGPRHTFRLARREGQAGFWYMHLELVPDGRWIDGDYRPDPEPRTVTDCAGDRELEEGFRRCTEIMAGYGRYREALLETAARELWLRLSELWAGRAARRFSTRMQEMLLYLRQQLTEPISRRDLARHFFITPEHVNALFKRELGVSPTQFVHRERVLLAQRLMRSEGLSVKEAAARVGFCDQFYFSKVFKKVMGVPPSRA